MKKHIQQTTKCQRTTILRADDSQATNDDIYNGVSEPENFRQAEILGLRLMKEGNYEEAITVFKEGLKLPGSKMDVIRTKAWKGPSPVGGSMGGYESNVVMQLDEFEMQGAHYNMACAYAQLKNVDMATVNLRKSFENGFNNYNIVRGDPDLEPLQGTKELDELLEQWDKRNGMSAADFKLPEFEFRSLNLENFSPFGLFDNNKEGEENKAFQLPKIF